MNTHNIEIKWEGPLKIEEVLNNYKDENQDCGVYQIYGPHILYGPNVLLYIGQTKAQTFSARFNQHKSNLLADDNFNRLNIYLGRLEKPSRYTEKKAWKLRRKDINLAEKILIYKYLPSYNSNNIQNYPKMTPYDEVVLIHKENRGQIHPEDKAPEDFFKDFQ